MKKMLSFLLAICLLCGILVVGAAGSFMPAEPERCKIALPALHYSQAIFDIIHNWPEELKMGLLTGKDAEDFESALWNVASTYALERCYRSKEPSDDLSELQRMADEHIAVMDAWIVEYLSDAFIEQVKAFKDALIKCQIAHNNFWWYYGIAGAYEGLSADLDALKYYKIGADSWHIEFDRDLTIAQYTVALIELELNLKRITDNVNGVNTTHPEPKWWESPPLPTWLHYVLKYVLFGWLWMRWF